MSHLKGLLYAIRDPYAVILNYHSAPLAELLMSACFPYQPNLQENEKASRLDIKLNFNFEKYHAAKAPKIRAVGMKWGCRTERKVEEWNKS